MVFISRKSWSVLPPPPRSLLLPLKRFLASRRVQGVCVGERALAPSVRCVPGSVFPSGLTCDLLRAGKWNNPGCVWLSLSQVSWLLISSEPQTILDGCSSDLLQSSTSSRALLALCEKHRTAEVQVLGGKAPWSPLPVYPSPSVVLGEILEPPPPPLLIWALVWVETLFFLLPREAQ